MSTPALYSGRWFSPLYHISEVQVTVVRQTMEQLFEQWGLPKYIRVDNGRPFGDPQRSSIPELALWLTGLGIQVVWNRPCSPKDNAVVERMQATTSRWTEVEQCADCTVLQQRLDKSATVQREHYQVRRLGAKSRKEVYPELWNNSRIYNSKEAFDISRVGTYLSQVRFTRKTNKIGAFTFYAQRVYAGSSHIHQTLCLQYDIDRNCFRLTDQASTVIGYVQADNFNTENILSLNVCQNRYLIAQT